MTDTKIHELASKAMIEIARSLRQRETSTEDRLWEVLRNRRLAQIKFRRQHPIPSTAYIADFFCYEANLVIEVDGSVHAHQTAEDQLRQQNIEALGYRVLRFTNEQIKHDLENTIIRILEVVLTS